MKRIGLAILCSALATSVVAAPKDCEELKKEIDAIVLEKEAEKEAAKASQA